MEKAFNIYFHWDGRVCRQTYWIYSIPLVAIYTALVVYDQLIPDVVFFSLMILVLVPSMMINIKRCHDRNRTGFFSLILFIPIVSLWPLIELGFLRGSEGVNDYGAPDSTWDGDH